MNSVTAQQLSEVRLSGLTSDPTLAAMFRRAELDDGLAGAEIDRPTPPRIIGAAVRVLEFA